MTNRRQEAIEKTAEYICGRTHPGLSPPCPFCTDTAEHLHEYILAPLREFPEEKAEKAVRDVIAVMAEDSTLEGNSRLGLIDFQVRFLMHDLKQLWHGQEVKGVCPKCGGSGLSKLTSWSEDQRQGEVLDCPDCKGTGENFNR